MTPFEVGVINSILQVGKLKLREVKWHDQSHTDRKRLKWPIYEAVGFYCLSRISFFFFKLFIYLFLAVSGLRHWVFVAARRLSLVAASWGYSSLVVCRLLIVVASLVAEQGL